MKAAKKSQLHLMLILAGINMLVALLFGFASPHTAYVTGAASPVHTLITTHFSHHSLQHLICNMLALYLLMTLFPTEAKKLFAAIFLCMALTALYVNNTGVQAYLGFSALLYCIPGLYCWHLINTGQFQLTGVILLILYIYLFIITPMSTLQGAQWQSMTDAHLLGFFAGFLIACASTAASRILHKYENKCTIE